MDMNHKDKNAKILLFTTVLFLVGATIFFVPAIVPTFAANTSSFTVSLTLDNSAPVVTYVAAVTDTPADGTTKLVNFTFNATDANGYLDIPASNAKVIINKSGISRQSSACASSGSAGTVAMYICNVTIYYYDAPGTWTINASVFDGASAQGDNLTRMFTVNTLYGIQLKTASLTFSGTPGQNDVSASNNPQWANNTGNSAFSYLNVTAFALVSGGNLIDAGNFTANVSANPIGHQLVNNSMVKLGDSAVPVGNFTNVSVYLDIPSGVGNGTYTSSSQWVITAG
jgi:hypothetical protein